MSSPVGHASSESRDPLWVIRSDRSRRPAGSQHYARDQATRRRPALTSQMRGRYHSPAVPQIGLRLLGTVLVVSAVRGRPVYWLVRPT